MPRLDLIELSSDSDSDPNPPARKKVQPAAIKRESPAAAAAAPTLSSLLAPAHRAQLATVDAEIEQLKRRLDEAQRRRTTILEEALRQKSSGVEEVKQESSGVEEIEQKSSGVEEVKQEPDGVEEIKREDDEEEQRGKKLWGLGAGFRAAQRRESVGVSESSATVTAAASAPETSRTKTVALKSESPALELDTPLFRGAHDSDDNFGGDPFFSSDWLLQENAPPSRTGRRNGTSSVTAAVSETSRAQKPKVKSERDAAPDFDADTPLFRGDVDVDDDDDDFGDDPFSSFDKLQENAPPSSTVRRSSVTPAQAAGVSLRSRRKIVLTAPDDEDDLFEPGPGLSQDNATPAPRSHRNGTSSVTPAPAAANPRRRGRRVIVGSDSEDFQPSGGDDKNTVRTVDVKGESDSDVPLTTRRVPKRRRTKSKTPRTATKPKKAKLTMQDLESDEETLHAYVPEPAAAPAVVPEPHSPTRPRIKHESFSDDEDLYSHPSAPPPPPRARTSRSPSVSIIAPTTPWQAPTGWNEAITTSSDPNRKPYAHEFIQTYPPFSFPGHLPPVLPLRFTRKFLSKWLGGSAHNVVVTPAIERMRENNHRISVYYCITPTWDPYLPQKPGAHGLRYMIAPIGNHDCEATCMEINDRLYPTFCKRAPKQWEYVGEYQITRRPFLPGELDAVPQIMKETWAKGIAGWRQGSKWGPELLEERGLVKKGESATEEQVMKWITEDKKIEFEALIYECKGYDWKLHNWLKERWEKEMGETGGIKVEVDEDEKV